MKKVRNTVLLGIVLVLILNFTSASAALEQVRRMTLNYFGQWYSGASESFLLNDSSLADFRIYTHGDSSDYMVQGGTITFTPTLFNDFSTATLAKGTFQAGTVILKGTLKKDGNVVYTPGAGDVLLQASVWGNAAKTDDKWDLVESSLTAGQYELTEVYLTLVNTGLASGIALDNGDVLAIGETEMDFSMTDAMGVANFLSPTPHTSVPGSPGASVINFVAEIPEPGTLILLSIGAVFLRKANR
jgi:hypothetical protein